MQKHYLWNSLIVLQLKGLDYEFRIRQIKNIGGTNKSKT